MKQAMKVWIDQKKCTGSGLCEMMVPSLFALGEDGLAYVVQDRQMLTVPGGEKCRAAVSPVLERDVTDAADACPGGCIHPESE